MVFSANRTSDRKWRHAFVQTINTAHPAEFTSPVAIRNHGAVRLGHSPTCSSLTPPLRISHSA